MAVAVESSSGKEEMVGVSVGCCFARTEEKKGGRILTAPLPLGLLSPLSPSHLEPPLSCLVWIFAWRSSEVRSAALVPTYPLRFRPKAPEEKEDGFVYERLEGEKKRKEE